MKIDLVYNHEETQTYKAKTPMKIPAYLESAAKKELKRIIDAGMIEIITHWTPQQSRGFFVEKRGKDEVSARLVANYRALNRKIRRPGVKPLLQLRSGFSDPKCECKWP